MSNSVRPKPIRTKQACFVPVAKNDDPPEIQAKNIWQYVDNISRSIGVVDANCKSALNGAEYFEAGHIREIQSFVRKIQNIVGQMRSMRESGSGI